MSAKESMGWATIVLLLGSVSTAAAQDSRTTAKPLPATRTIKLPTKPSGPRLELSQTLWDFGELWYGDPCRTEVQLKNTGDATLKITKVKSSCGCTVAKPKKRELAPGETDMMTVTYNTKKNVTQVSQSITIETNDPVKPRQRLQIKGIVRNVFNGDPRLRLILGQILPESKVTASIRLTNNMDEPVHPTLRTPPASSPFEIKLEEIKPGQEYRLVATTRPPLKMGVSNTSAIIDTGIKRIPTLTIPVTAIAMERVSVSPPKLPVFEAQKRPGTRIVRLNYVQNRPIKIRQLKSNNPRVKLAEMKQPPNSGMKSVFASRYIRVTIPAWADLPDEGTTIEIYTDDIDPKFQKLVVPIEKHQTGARKAKRKRSLKLPALPPKP